MLHHRLHVIHTIHGICGIHCSVPHIPHMPYQGPICGYYGYYHMYHMTSHNTYDITYMYNIVHLPSKHMYRARGISLHTVLPMYTIPAYPGIHTILVLCTQIYGGPYHTDIM